MLKNVSSYALQGRNNIYYEDILRQSCQKDCSRPGSYSHKLWLESVILQTVVSRRFDESLGGVDQKNVIIAAGVGQWGQTVGLWG